jgi:hypothetical protein
VYWTEFIVCGDGAFSSRTMPATPETTIGETKGWPSSCSCSPGGTVCSVNVVTSGRMSCVTVVAMPEESVTVR